eukprot:CAMPEP_0119044684 /NCGR_PEP_ID=MMETSP1177-20130426/33558_1 /TAXON_ID=2985 /ORGANISM="Ochromonas sp, Strain CCMP1899" /LENGTH=439 /DNA_ID=CAMNT_0007015173 /DNA_START=388 /DNA_END=1705 /DNA_ORIENTATION=+
MAEEPGESVKEDDVVAIVETDKVTMDIRAKKDGVFMEGLVGEGDEVSVGSPLYTIDTSVTETTQLPAHSESTDDTPRTTAVVPVENKAESVMVSVPVMGESITTGMLASWEVKSGSVVAADEVVGAIETDKVTVEIRSPFAGRIIETYSEVGDEINVGEPLYVLIPLEEGDVSQTAPTPKTPEPIPQAIPTPQMKPATPEKAPTPTPVTPPITVVTPAPSTLGVRKGGREETRVKMSRMRLRIAQRLKEAQNTAAMLTTFQEIDMTNLIAMRNKYKEEFEKIHGVKLGFMSAFVRASTAALLEFPAVNGVIDDATNEIVYREYVDISVAVSSPTGLVVPVLRNTNNMDFADVEKAISFYGKKAKDGQLALEDMTGGTFTISNGGVFGSLFGTPIINIPQSAILGMHATKMRAVIIDGKAVARPMMYVALTYDHRLIDGR